MADGREQKMAALERGMGGPPQPNAGGVSSVRSLEDAIMLDKSSVLNATPGSDVSFVLTQSQSELMMISEDDEQLLLFVFFKQLVNIKSIRIRGATPPAGSGMSAPKIVKLWKNTPNMDFNDANDSKPVQQFELSESDLQGDKDLALDYLKFKNVDNLTIFIENNQDDEEVTFLNNIQFYGNAIDDFNMNNLKKSG